MKLALRELYSNRECTVRYGTGNGPKRTVFIFLYATNINCVLLQSDEMSELHGVKLEESIELNFSDEISSPPKSSSQRPIGIYLRFTFKKTGNILNQCVFKSFIIS